MPIWIIVVDLGLAVVNLLCGLAILWLWFHALGNTAPDDERPGRTKYRIALWGVILSLPFFIAMIYDLRQLAGQRPVAIETAVPQAVLLLLFGWVAQKLAVAYRRNHRVETLVVNGHPEEAVELLEGWIRAARTPDPELHNLLGLVHLNAGDAELAAEQFRNAVEISPESSVHLCNLAIALNKLDQTDRALELIERAEEKDSANRALYVYNRCYFLAEAGRVAEARALLPQAERFRQQMIARLPPLQQRHMDEALAKIQHVCDQSPTDPLPSD
jgi:tetratricopeptide (TPR) repeat protein